jgi:lipopolysaccharide transport system permease protein
MQRFEAGTSSSAISLLATAWRFRRVLSATSILELKQRYAGSALGPIWIILYPLIFLSIYLFLYLVIFQVRFPGMSELGFVVFVFSGLVPYLVMMESLTRGALIIKENIHLIQNVIMPMELVPLRLVIVSFIAQSASFVLLLILLLVDGDLSWRIVFLPGVLLLVAAFILGIVYYVASLGVVFNDVSYIVNLTMVALMFLSPIAFKAEMVPEHLAAIVYLNPISYPLEALRWSLLASHEANLFRLLAFPVIAVILFAVGTSFFRRFKGLMADNV